MIKKAISCKISKDLLLETVSEDLVLRISDEMEVLDEEYNDYVKENECRVDISSKDLAVKQVYIGKKLSKIATLLPFGTEVTDIFVDEENEYFKSIDGVLFSKDGKRLIMYPAGRDNTPYVIPEGTEYIEKFAFYVDSLPERIEIPESVKEVGSNAFYEMDDKGFALTKEAIMCMTTIYCPAHLKAYMVQIWNKKTYQKPTVVYYGEKCKVYFEGKGYKDFEELCDVLGLEVGKLCYSMEEYELDLEKAVRYCLEEKKKSVYA